MKQSNAFFGRLGLIMSTWLLFSFGLFAQIEPQPCDDPDNNGADCFCEEVTILGTLDKLVSASNTFYIINTRCFILCK